jgi:hypothetical protein
MAQRQGPNARLAHTSGLDRHHSVRDVTTLAAVTTPTATGRLTPTRTSIVKVMIVIIQSATTWGQDKHRQPRTARFGYIG